LLQQNLKGESCKHIRCKRDTVRVGVVVSHAVLEVVDIWEKFIVDEVIVGVHDEDEVGRHARALPKKLIISLSYRIIRRGISEANYPN
jgi:hypothetical protein